MNSSMCVGDLKYIKEKLPQAQIDKILAILDDKNFGVKTEKDLKKIVEKIHCLRENLDDNRSA